jgi:hypothetical protein
VTGDRPVELHPVLAADLAAYASLLADFLTHSPASAASYSRFSRRWPENVITDLRKHAALLTAALTTTEDE